LCAREESAYLQRQQGSANPESLPQQSYRHTATESWLKPVGAVCTCWGKPGQKPQLAAAARVVPVRACTCSAAATAAPATLTCESLQPAIKQQMLTTCTAAAAGSARHSHDMAP
jgi:hypothetical protein